VTTHFVREMAHQLTMLIKSVSNIKNATNAPREMPVPNVTQKRLVIDFLQQLIQLPVPLLFNAQTR
jgi:hypothetical protein